jgi:hypothetical protein
MIHCGDLADEVARKVVTGPAPVERFLVSLQVAPDREDVVDAGVVQLDEEVLGLLPSEAFAEDVRDGIGVELVLDEAQMPRVPGRFRVTRRWSPFGVST